MTKIYPRYIYCSKPRQISFGGWDTERCHMIKEGMVFELVMDKLPKTYLYSKEIGNSFYADWRHPSESFYLAENFKPVPIDYNQYWAKLNE